MNTARKPKNLASFRESHDRSIIVPNKIRAALAGMISRDGPEAWEYEGDVVKLAAISQSDIGMFRELFAAHIVEARTPGRGNATTKRVWFADAKVAKRARGE